MLSARSILNEFINGSNVFIHRQDLDSECNLDCVVEYKNELQSTQLLFNAGIFCNKNNLVLNRRHGRDGVAKPLRAYGNYTKEDATEVLHYVDLYNDKFEIWRHDGSSSQIMEIAFKKAEGDHVMVEIWGNIA